MATTDDIFDHTMFLQMVEEKMVRAVQHPAADLWILNYTSMAQFAYEWNDVTRACRGLIVQGNPLLQPQSRIVGRPFEKFFNLSDHDDGGKLGALPLDRPFEVYGKMDGSLGILYEAPDGPAMSTRGSFSSDQALWATKWLRSHLDGRSVPAGVTLLFEIIYPANRIVVDYGDHEGLTLLAAIDVETGADVAIPEEWSTWLPVVQKYDGISDVQTIATMMQSNESDWANHEGFVLRFAPLEPGHPSPRVKAKFAEYVRLHRIITGVSAKTVWEYLSEGKNINEMLEHVPDEFYAWVKKTVADLESQFVAVEEECKTVFADASVDHNDRKETAIFFQKQKHRAVLFKMLDGRDYAPLIWRTIKPVYERAFKTDIDA